MGVGSQQSTLRETFKGKKEEKRGHPAFGKEHIREDSNEKTGIETAGVAFAFHRDSFETFLSPAYTYRIESSEP